MSNKKSTYSYRRLEDKYLPDVQYLFNKIFKRKVSLDYLKNKYDTSILGLKYICMIAFDGDQPIAFYGAIPQLFQLESTTFYAAHACDSITLPAYQKQGLHFNLATKAYEIMKENGVKFVYAFHSENTYYSTKKLGWKEHVSMKRFHISVPIIPLAKIVRKVGFQKSYDNITSRYLNPYKSENQSINNIFGKRNGNIYDANFFLYKNSFNNHHLIELHNCTFWIKIETILRVGFFKANSETDFIKAINQLKKIAFTLGCNEILFQVNADSKMHELLQEISVPKESWLIGYLSFDDSIDLNQLEFTYADLDTF